MRRALYALALVASFQAHAASKAEEAAELVELQETMGITSELIQTCAASNNPKRDDCVKAMDRAVTIMERMGIVLRSYCPKSGKSAAYCESQYANHAINLEQIRANRDTVRAAVGGKK